MGMGRDYIMEQWCEEAAQQDTYSNGYTDIDYLEKALWVTKDGTILPIVDMTDSHVTNTFNMLKRKGYIVKANFFELEMYRRGLIKG